jgi:hypothetical protein
MIILVESQYPMLYSVSPHCEFTCEICSSSRYYYYFLETQNAYTTRKPKFAMCLNLRRAHNNGRTTKKLFSGRQKK